MRTKSQLTHKRTNTQGAPSIFTNSPAATVRIHSKKGRHLQTNSCEFLDIPKENHRCQSHRRHEYTSSLMYNKWYIKPQFRMKKPIRVQTQQTSDLDYMYNGLYQEKILDRGSPFRYHDNQRLKILDKLSASNVILLSSFRMKREERHKRVPKIINMILQQTKAKNKLLIRQI